MAIQEHTEEINNIDLTATKCGIILTDDNRIANKITGSSVNVVTTSKVVTGTRLQIDAYIKANNLKDYTQALPVV